MTKRWLPLVLLTGLVVARALGVRLTVGPRRRYWAGRGTQGDLHLVALGDSLTQGIGSSRPTTSWLALYAAHVEAVTGRTLRVENRAVYGAKIADLIATQLPLPPDATLVVLCIGANDAGRTSAEEFRGCLRTVCAQLPAGSVVGDLPEFQWGGRIEAAAELAQVVRDVVAEFPDLRLARVEAHTAGTKILTELAGDFFHPGDPAYRRIADAFVGANSPAREGLTPRQPRLLDTAHDEVIDATRADLRTSRLGQVDPRSSAGTHAPRHQVGQGQLGH